MPDQAAPPEVPSEQSGRAPSIALPKGGGSLRAIDEKLSVNAANGTLDLSFPIPSSPARSSLGTGFTLRYSSGSGNGPFGLGWSLSLPSIARSTSKRLPQYRDADESDTFVLSGAEDLVPAYLVDGGGNWIKDIVVAATHTVVRYRPRIEAGFSRIERVVVAGEPGCFWKVTSRENVVIIFGRTIAARVADPTDPTRVYRWLPEWTYDDRGNCAEFVYKAEDLTNVQAVVNEQHRLSGMTPIVNRYLKRIRYGNEHPYDPGPNVPYDPAQPTTPGYFFETVFDYGEHDLAAPTPLESTTWPCRFDPFTDCRGGFDLRTYRLCRRILHFHSFTELAFAPDPYLVRSMDFTYQSFGFAPGVYTPMETDFITSIVQRGYKKTGAATYASAAWPALDFSYQPLEWNTDIQTIAPDDLVGAPGGVGDGYQWLDLYADGMTGILTEQASAWFYKANLGNGTFERARAVAPKPTPLGVGAGFLSFEDLDANGERQLVAREPQLRGYFSRTSENAWLPFRAFPHVTTVDTSDPNARFIDLTGDGKADLLISEDRVFTWYPSLGTGGFETPFFAAKPWDESTGPAILFADGSETIFVADMNGDSLSEIVRVRNGEVCYWPNLGYGRFGAKVSMASAPLFDRPDRFDPRRIQFADISGTGAADLIYLGRDGFYAWINLAGNAWTAAQAISPFPGTESPNKVSALDLLGNGTASLVWSSDLPANASAPLRYIDLMGGSKPYVLSGLRNNLGKTIGFEFKSSNYYALRDKAAGTPWATKLPFPTMCLSRVVTTDSVSGAHFAQSYAYRHGYYDHAEREFRGFGMVEQIDIETFDRFAPSVAAKIVDATVDQPPVRTRTWYHTGAYIESAGILQAFAKDYYRNGTVAEAVLPDPSIESPPGYEPTAYDYREAARACKGMLLRQETYADDGTLVASTPYTATQHTAFIRMLQPRIDTHYAVFIAIESEALTYTYERNAADPRIAHTLHTLVDEMGNVLESASVVYGRVTADISLPSIVQDAQRAIRTIYTQTAYTADAIDSVNYRLRQVADTQTFELSGIVPVAAYFTSAEIRAAFLAAMPIGYEISPTAGFVQRRALSQTRTLYAADAAPQTALPLGVLGTRGLSYRSFTLTFTPSLLASLYGSTVSAGMLGEGAYVSGDATIGAGLFPATDAPGQWWSAGGTILYPPTPAATFWLPSGAVDPFGNATTYHYYGLYALLVDGITDSLGNTIRVEQFDFRLLVPQSIMDINQNLSDAAFDIRGMVVGTALRGKGSEADDLAGFTADLTDPQIDAFLADPVANGATLLANATSRFVYRQGSLPSVTASIDRETHAAPARASGTPAVLQYAFAYFDGFGRTLMTKVQAEPGKATLCTVASNGSYTLSVIDTTPNLRWIGSGRTIYNNKAKPVMKYEPYFSTMQAFEDVAELVETGVTPVITYDPLGRVVRTDFPDATSSSVAFTPWEVQYYDQNDSVLLSGWYAARIGGGLGPQAQAAASRSATHNDTPGVTRLDSLGHSIYSVADNTYVKRLTSTVVEEFYATFTQLDVQGNPLAVHDARDNVVVQSRYDMLSRACATTSMDAGPRTSFTDVAGKSSYAWDAKGNRFRNVYDALNRIIRREIVDAAAVQRVYESTVYGTDVTKNQNGEVFERYDTSGTLTYDAYDFKRNQLSVTRAFTQDHTGWPDWTNPAAVHLGPSFTELGKFDALNRTIDLTSADGSITTNTFSAAGLLNGVSVELRGTASTPFITSITHDAKGQRQRIAYGNGVVSSMAYDPQTFRVTRIQTVRTDGARLQDLNYTYDPVGNVTTIVDAAQSTYFFNNVVVAPQNDFIYDAVYWLRSATGREQVAQNAPVDRFDGSRSNLPLPSDGSSMQRYVQEYDYDAAGNMLAMVHRSGVGPFVNAWTRVFTPEASTNRLAVSQVAATSEPYVYDLQGNVTSLPGVVPMTWDFKDRLQALDLVGGGTTYYTYAGDGGRTRKVIERLGTVVDERLYIGRLEIFTRRNGQDITLQRESLHILDGARRLALIDSRVQGQDDSAALTVRYQFSNHLDTATLELDATAAIISYEEYYPFGSTSFQAVNGALEVVTKRYRYTGKERDEETGFYYHGARYYAPWLARWLSCDPTGVADGLNVYRYAKNNPVRLSDPTGTQGHDPQKNAPKSAETELSDTITKATIASEKRRLKLGIPHWRPHVTAPVPNLKLTLPEVKAPSPATPIARPDQDPFEEEPAAAVSQFPPPPPEPKKPDNIDAPAFIYSSLTNSSQIAKLHVLTGEYNHYLSFGSAGVSDTSQFSLRSGLTSSFELGAVGNLTLGDSTTGNGGITAHFGTTELKPDKYSEGAIIQVTGGSGQDPSGNSSPILSASITGLQSRGGDDAPAEIDRSVGIAYSTFGSFGPGTSSVPHVLSAQLLAERTKFLDSIHRNSVFIEGLLAPTIALGTLDEKNPLYGVRAGPGAGFTTSADGSALTFSATAFGDFTSRGVGYGGTLMITIGGKTADPKDN